MKVLIAAAHPDDEVLGCGATIARHCAMGDDVHVLIMAEGITSRDDKRNASARKSELSELAETAGRVGDVLGCRSTELLSFPDNRMDSETLLDIVKAVERKHAIIKPDIVYTHHAGDLNIDHRVTHNAVVTACRPYPGQCVKTILFFEVPSSTDWQIQDKERAFMPNWYVDITRIPPTGAPFDGLEIKTRALEIYRGEMRAFPHSRSVRAVRSLAEWRGAAIGAGAAEAFLLGRHISA